MIVRITLPKQGVVKRTSKHIYIRIDPRQKCCCPVCCIGTCAKANDPKGFEALASKINDLRPVYVFPTGTVKLG